MLWKTGGRASRCTATARCCANQPKCRKIAFVSAHCAIDPTNGAATSTLDALALLAESGFDCHVYCCSHLDSLAEVAIEDVLDQAGARYGFRDVTIGNHQAQFVFRRPIATCR